MLSLTKGREIATFTKGKNFKGKKIYLTGEHDFKNNQKSQNIVPNNKRYELLKDGFFLKNKIKKKEKIELKKLLEEDVKIGTIDNERLQDLYELVLKEIDNRLKFELDFSDLKGIEVFPIPQKFSERIFVPAPSGSGKSTFIGMYLKQLRILYPKRKIVIFSRVLEDKPLDRFSNLERIPLDLEFLNDNPLDVEDFRGDILIFDDIDTIINKSLVTMLRNFRDDVLECGRHYKITCISTSHLIMNFGATRTLINEAQSIVLFPRGASFYQLKNFLDKYLGFDNHQINEIRNLPSRWVFIWKEYPKYLIHEKGVLIW
tara:strand:- start:98 stop:1045 length:948 start_codon:yes stop_codon:yes gene_type:complete